MASKRVPSAPDPIDRLAEWIGTPVNRVEDASARWAPVAALIARRLDEPVQANIDPFLLPLA